MGAGTCSSAGELNSCSALSVPAGGSSSSWSLSTEYMDSGTCSRTSFGCSSDSEVSSGSRFSGSQVQQHSLIEVLVVTHNESQIHIYFPHQTLFHYFEAFSTPVSVWVLDAWEFREVGGHRALINCDGGLWIVPFPFLA